MSLSLSKKATAVKPSSTLEITAKANTMKAEGIDIISFGVGEPDFTTPDNINEAAIRAIHDGFTRYTPASGTLELKKAVCEKFRTFNQLTYQPNQIVISNGGKHALTNIFEAILNPGDEVIIPVPYWLTYPEIVKLNDGIPVYIYGEKENGYKVTAQQISAATTDKTKALVLNSPNNPTGAVYPEEELQAIAEVAIAKDFYVVADEMYEHLTYGEQKHISIASLGLDIYQRTITCSGVSKSYAMTGWRIGYTGSSARIAKLMGSLQSHQTSNPNSIAQKATVEALLGNQSTIEAMRVEFDKRRKYMYQRVSQFPLLDVLEPEGAFYVFIDFTNVLKMSYQGQPIHTINRVAQILLEDYHVAVVPCDDFGFDQFIRLSYATSLAAIETGLDRLEQFITSLKEK